MKCHLMSLGWKVWEETKNEYKIEDQAPTKLVELAQYEGNSKALHFHLEWIDRLCIYKIYAMQDCQTNLG